MPIDSSGLRVAPFDFCLFCCPCMVGGSVQHLLRKKRGPRVRKVGDEGEMLEEYCMGQRQ